MRRAALFLFVLFAGLGLLVAVGYVALTHTTRDWFESDLDLRSKLAVISARQSLESSWGGNRARLTETLSDITRDERIMGAAACSLDGESLAATDSYPREFTCRSVLERMRVDAPSGSGSWSMTTEPMRVTSRIAESGRRGASSIEVDSPCRGPLCRRHGFSARLISARLVSTDAPAIWFDEEDVTVVPSLLAPTRSP